MSSESKQQGSGGFSVSFIFFVLITFCDHYVQIKNNPKKSKKPKIYDIALIRVCLNLNAKMSYWPSLKMSIFSYSLILTNIRFSEYCPKNLAVYLSTSWK